MNVEEGTPITEQGIDLCVGPAEPASTEERLLVAQAKAGRTSAFGELYERHRLRIYRTAFRILGNQQDAEDAAQRSFQRAFTNFSRFREDSAFSTWMTRIVINEALMLLRQRRRTRTAQLEGNSDGDVATSVLDLPDKVPTPEATLAENELCAVVTQAISHLRENLRTVVLLRELQGLTSAETARRLGLSVAAVKGRIFRAKRVLRRQLKRKLSPYSVSISGL